MRGMHPYRGSHCYKRLEYCRWVKNVKLYFFCRVFADLFIFFLLLMLFMSVNFAYCHWTNTLW